MIGQFHIHRSDALVGGPIHHATGVLTAGVHWRILVSAHCRHRLRKLLRSVCRRYASRKYTQSGAVIVDKTIEVVGLDKGH